MNEINGFRIDASVPAVTVRATVRKVGGGFVELDTESDTDAACCDGQVVMPLTPEQEKAYAALMHHWRAVIVTIAKEAQNPAHLAP